MALSGQTAITDKLTELLDMIEQVNDPAARLAAYRHAIDFTRGRLIQGRDRAAYEARSRYSAKALAQMLDADVASVYWWADCHRDRTGAPPLRTMRRSEDLSNAVNLAESLKVRR